MSHTQKRRRASHTRCARRSLVDLTAAASRAVDDVLSSGIATSNPRSERTGEKTSDQTILARQATAPSPVAVLESWNAAASRKDELLDSDTTTEIMASPGLQPPKARLRSDIPKDIFAARHDALGTSPISQRNLNVR